MGLRLGKTLGELAQMPARELYLWIAYDRENPISDRRGDIQAAQIASAIYQSQGVQISISEALLDWSPLDNRADDASDDAISAFFESMM